MQEVFLRILKYRHTFRGEGAFVVWIYQIAHNVHRDHLGQWKRAFPGRTAAMDGIDGASVVPPDQLQRREEQALLHTALNALPPEQREVLLLSRFQGLAYHEIAAILGCTVGAVKVRVYRCPKRAFPPKSARYLAGALVAQTTDPSACPGDGLAARRRRPRPEPASSE